MSPRTTTSRRRSTAARSRAARKGWQTRRANAQKRSQAARKGWQTRRANAEKRSQAALKGWETRRKRESMSMYDYLVTMKFRSKGRRHRKDIVITAPGETDEDTIKDLIRGELNGPSEKLEPFLESGKLTIVRGPQSENDEPGDLRWR